MNGIAPRIRCGRLESFGDGYRIRVEPNNPDSPLIDRQGEPLTMEQAEEALDRLDEYTKGKR